jgi:hypothetical protein
MHSSLLGGRHVVWGNLKDQELEMDEKIVGNIMSPYITQEELTNVDQSIRIK